MWARRRLNVQQQIAAFKTKASLPINWQQLSFKIQGESMPTARDSYGLLLTYSFWASMMRRAESLVEAVEAGMPSRSRKDGGAIFLRRIVVCCCSVWCR